MNAAPLLRAEGVWHQFGQDRLGLVVLKNVTLSVTPGECLLLMGPSGSGKSTLLQILGGLLRPTRGSIIFNDIDLSSAAEHRRSQMRLRNFGFVFQSNNLFPTLTATENVMIAFDLLGTTVAEARARSQSLLDAVGLGDRLNAFPAQMSGGQRQRVGIARALAASPRVLLADEPTAALDYESGQRVVEMMRGIAKNRDSAVVIVTHDHRIVHSADRIIRLEDGHIVDPPLSEMHSIH